MSNTIIKKDTFNFLDQNYHVYVFHKDWIENDSKYEYAVNAGIYIYYGKSGDENNYRNDIYVGSMSALGDGEKWSDRVSESGTCLESWKKTGWMYTILVVSESSRHPLINWPTLKDVILKYSKDNASKKSYRLINRTIPEIDLDDEKYKHCEQFIRHIEKEIEYMAIFCREFKDAAGNAYRRYVIPELMRKLSANYFGDNRDGIYFYFGRGGENNGFKGTVYVGLSKDLKTRLVAPHSGDVKKWINPNLDTTVVFVPYKKPDGTALHWSKEQREYIEDRFHTMAENAKRYRVVNDAGTSPGGSPQTKKDELEKFIEAATSMLKAVGYNVFDYVEIQK